MIEKDLNWDAVKKKITEAKISDALSSVKFQVSSIKHKNKIYKVTKILCKLGGGSKPGLQIWSMPV